MNEQIQRLMKEKVSKVQVNSGFISLKYDGRQIKNQINVSNHLTWVGNWNQHKGANTILLENNLISKDMKDFIAIAVHECVEKYVTQRYHYPIDTTSHQIATQVERSWLQSVRGNWRSHEIKVGKIYSKEDKR